MILGVQERSDIVAHIEGELSRDEMLAVIESGGSVFFRGRLITKRENVPSEGEIDGIEGLESEIAAELAAVEEKKKKLARLKAAEAKVEKKAAAES